MSKTISECMTGMKDAATALDVAFGDFKSAVYRWDAPKVEPMCDIHEVDTEPKVNCLTCKNITIDISEMPCKLCYGGGGVIDMWEPMPQPSHATPAPIPERFAVHVPEENATT